MVAESDPRRSSVFSVFRAVSQTRMRVPLLDVVANILPSWLTAMHASSALWAFIETGALDVLE